MLPFSLKESRQTNPLHVPQWGPYGEKYLLRGNFYLSRNVLLHLSLRVPGKGVSNEYLYRAFELKQKIKSLKRCRLIFLFYCQ